MNFRSRARAMDWPSEVLPTPGGPTKHRMGSRILMPCLRSPFLSQFFDGKIFQDTVLDLFEIVMVFVKRGPWPSRYRWATPTFCSREGSVIHSR